MGWGGVGWGGWERPDCSACGLSQSLLDWGRVQQRGLGVRTPVQDSATSSAMTALRHDLRQRK